MSAPRARSWTGAHVGVRPIDVAVEKRPCYRCGRKVKVKGTQPKPPFCRDCYVVDPQYIADVRAAFAPVAK